MNNKLKKKIILVGIVLLLAAILGLSYAILRTQRPLQQVSDQPPVCTNAATCSWEAVTGATSYEYKITDTATNTVIKNGSTPPDVRSVSFTPVPGKTYKCEVKVINSCGNSSTGSANGTCPSLSSTPSVTLTPTTSPTPTVTVPPNVTITPTKSPTPTVTKSPTPTKPNPTVTKVPPVSTKAPTPTKSPTPTVTKAPTATPTRVPTNTPIPTSTTAPTMAISTNTPIPPTQPPVVVQVSPRPTIPPTGSVAQTIGIIGVVVLTVIGGAFLFIL